jgi:hypothetical protein
MKAIVKFIGKNKTPMLFLTELFIGDKSYFIQNGEVVKTYIVSEEIKIALEAHLFSGKCIGKPSPKAKWLKDLDIVEVDYDRDKVLLVEKLRLNFEKRTGLTLGSWVKDTEDGYIDRYKG